MRRFIINCLDHASTVEQNHWAEVSAETSNQAHHILRHHDILKRYETYELVSSGAADNANIHPELINWGGGLACA